MGQGESVAQCVADTLLGIDLAEYHDQIRFLFSPRLDSARVAKPRI